MEKKDKNKIIKTSSLVTNKIKNAKLEINELINKNNEDKKIDFLKDEYNKTLDKADEIKEEIIAKIEEKADSIESKDGFKVFGIKTWRILSYFVIYSFFGFLLETVYGLLTKGVIESRKSFLYGPFCGIYGFGAVIMILTLQYFKKNNYTLFFGGYVVGSIIEYIVSLFGEMILHVKWWDYSNEPFNLNGRICLFYSIAWGLLAIYLITHVNPFVDKIIDKIKSKLPRLVIPIIFDIGTAFLICDCIISGIAINVFYARLVHDYNINIPNAQFFSEAYNESEKNPKWFKFTEKYFSNEKMLRTYPNLKFEDTDGNIIFIKNILNDIKPYYIKIFDVNNRKIKLTNVEAVTYTE